MIRTCFTAYLIAATWLGPVVCCCTLNQFSGGTGGCCAASAKKEHPHRHAAHHHHGGHHSKAERHQAPAGKLPAKCPCERHNAQLVVVVERSGAVDSAHGACDLRSYAPVCDIDALLAGQPGSAAIERHALDTPVLNGRAILRAHHSLRC